MDIYRQTKYLDLREMKYERLAEQLRRNSFVPAEQQDLGSYVVCTQKWQGGEMLQMSELQRMLLGFCEPLWRDLEAACSELVEEVRDRE